MLALALLTRVPLHFAFLWCCDISHRIRRCICFSVVVCSLCYLVCRDVRRVRLGRGVRMSLRSRSIWLGLVCRILCSNQSFHAFPGYLMLMSYDQHPTHWCSLSLHPWHLRSVSVMRVLR